MATPAIRKVKALPGAPARVSRSAAIGLEPSEQTSITVVAARVSASPSRVGPKYCENSASGTKARTAAASTTPKKIQRRIIRESLRPPRAIALRLAALGFRSCRASRNAGPKRKSAGRSRAFGFGGSTPRFTKRSASQPVSTPTPIDSPMNANIHCQPISAARMKVSDSEFHGLDTRKARVWPSEAPFL